MFLTSKVGGEYFRVILDNISDFFLNDSRKNDFGSNTENKNTKEKTKKLNLINKLNSVVSIWI